MDDLFMNTTKPAVPREAPVDPLAAEVEAFKDWSDFSYGMDLKGNFNPLIFWASPISISHGKEDTAALFYPLSRVHGFCISHSSYSSELRAHP